MSAGELVPPDQASAWNTSTRRNPAQSQPFARCPSLERPGKLHDVISQGGALWISQGKVPVQGQLEAVAAPAGRVTARIRSCRTVSRGQRREAAIGQLDEDAERPLLAQGRWTPHDLLLTAVAIRLPEGRLPANNWSHRPYQQGAIRSPPPDLAPRYASDHTGGSRGRAVAGRVVGAQDDGSTRFNRRTRVPQRAARGLLELGRIALALRWKAQLEYGGR